MSAPCTERLEVLGAWLDGEATEAEAEDLQRHLAVCPGCREASGWLADLGASVARQPRVEVPADFAVRTARVALAANRPSRWTAFRRWAEELASGSSGREGALGVLLGREGRGRPSPALVLVLFGLPALLLGLYNPTLPDVFLRIAAAGLLVALPMHHWQARAARLGSLRRGRALEEILLSGLSPARLLDGLAVAGLGSLAWAALGFEVLLLPTGEVCWLPAVLALAWLGSYAAACWSLGEGLRLGLLAAGAALTLAVSAGAGMTFAWAGAIAYLFPSLAACRWLALRRLQSPTRAASGAQPRNLWLVGPSENAVVMRERMRRATRFGPVLRHLPLAVLTAAWTWQVSHDPRSTITWLSLGLLLVGVVGGAALRTLGAVLHERERGTWEPLLQANAAGREFVLGWLLVATGEAVLGLALLLPLALLTTNLALNAPAIEEAVLVLELCALAWVSALLGLSISAGSRTPGEARSSLLAWACGLTMLALALVAVGQALKPDVQLMHVGLVAVGLVGGIAGFWSSRALHRRLSLAPPPAPVATLPGRLAVCSAWAGAALGLVAHSWPLPPALRWGSALQFLVGYAAGWLSGHALAWLLAPLLGYAGDTRLVRWGVTVFWATLFGLTVGGLRMLLTVLDVCSGNWAYDQIALSAAVSAAVAALVALRGRPLSAPQVRTTLPRALAVSVLRTGMAVGILGALLYGRFYVTPVDVAPILAQVQARRLAAQNRPSAPNQLDRLLRGDWPAGASFAYFSAPDFRIQDVVELMQTPFPLPDPAVPLAGEPNLVSGIERRLELLASQSNDRAKQLEYGLLRFQFCRWSGSRWSAMTALSFLHAEVNRGGLSLSQLQLLRDGTLDGAGDFLAECDSLFAGDLKRLEEQRAFHPDRPEFYWTHRRRVIESVYVNVRPLCSRLENPLTISARQQDILAQYWSDSEAGPVVTDYAGVVGEELGIRRRLRDLREIVRLQLEQR